MRTMMWTPLPPERSGIADYSYELLEALAELVDVTAVSRHGDRATVPAGVPVLDPDRAARAEATHLYQMGNNTEFHSWIYRQALAVPGIVVLHDTSLLDFNVSYLGGIESPDFRAEVRYAHGPIWGDRDDPALIYGWPAVDVDGVKHIDRLTMTMERRIVSASRGVIVHDPFRADWLRARYPGMPVFTVASGAPVLDEDDRRAAIRATLGWTDDHVVFGVFGGFTAIKRMRVAVLAFAQVRRRWPQARLLIVGHAREPEIVTDVRQAIAEQGLAESVRVVPGPDKDEFQDLIVATDAVIGLRWPTAGETSAVMMRTFGAGRIFITSDLTQHRHLDPAFCWLTPTDPADEARELIGHLERVVCWPEEAREAGRPAREYVRKHACWPVVAAAYRDAAATVSATVAATASAGATPVERAPGAAGGPGVNVFADVRSDADAAGSARRYALALAGATPNMTFTEFNTRAAPRPHPVPRALADLRRGKDYPIDLWLVDLADFHHIPEHAIDRHTIATWRWERPEVAGPALAQLGRVDELWVQSTFVAEAFRAAAGIPVTVIPEIIPRPAEVAADRAALGIPDGGAVVLVEYHAGAVERDNPQAAVAAFGRAFGPAARGGAARLVVHAVDLDRAAEAPAELAHAVSALGGTLLAGADRDRLLATCDVYLSLHRTANFGRGMAEAMARGRPVVATGFGGNVDFMPTGSAAVVGFAVRTVADEHQWFSNEFTRQYLVGRTLAEADVDQAARWLVRLAGSAGLRREMGARAAQAIRSRCDPDVVAAAMLRRLGRVSTLRRGRP